MNAPLSVVEERDPKGHYRRARLGLISSMRSCSFYEIFIIVIDFTGIDSPYEEPSEPEIELPSHLLSVEECIQVMIILF